MENLDGEIITFGDKDDSSEKEILKEQKILIEKNDESQNFKLIQEKWKHFRENLEKINGINLFKTMGTIIRAKLLIQNDQEEITSSLEELVDLVNLMEKNKKIIDFLCREKDKIEEEEEYEIINIPYEISEFIPLDKLEKNLNGIKNLLKTKLKKEDRKKVEQLYGLYLEQKNIIIEHETNLAKEEILRSNNNYQKYIDQDKKNIKSAQEKEREKFETKLRERNKKEEKPNLEQKSKEILRKEEKKDKEEKKKMKTLKYKIILLLLKIQI